MSSAQFAAPGGQLQRSRLRIRFRGNLMESFSVVCLPSCSMIYLKHPSFGIHLKHLTAKGKKRKDKTKKSHKKKLQTVEPEKSEMHAGCGEGPFPS